MVRLLTQAAIRHSPSSLLGGAGDAAETVLMVQGERERHLSPEQSGLQGGSTGLWKSTASMQLTSLGENPAEIPGNPTGKTRGHSQGRGGGEGSQAEAQTGQGP